MASKKFILQPRSHVVSFLAFAKVTLLSPLLAPCCSCWHAGWHMACSGAKQRASLRLYNHISVFAVQVPSSSSFSLCPCCLHLALFPGLTQDTRVVPKLGRLLCDSFFSMIEYMPERCVCCTVAAGHTQHGALLQRMCACVCKEKANVDACCVITA